MRVRFGKLTAALLATTTVGLGVVEISANLQAQRQVRQLVARHDGLRIGGVSAEPLRGRIIVEGVQMDRGAVRVSIGTLTLPAPRPAFGLVGSAMASPFDDEPGAPEKEETPGPVEKAMPSPDVPKAAAPAAAAPKSQPSPQPASIPETASADNVTIVSGTDTYRIKRIDLTGTSLSNADLARLLDTANTEPVDARLKKLNATSIVIPEIVIEDMTSGSEHRAIFQQVILSGVVAGRVTAGSVGGVKIALKSGEDTLNGTTGAIQTYGVNLPQIVHLVAATRTDDAEPIVPIYDSVVVNAIKIGNAKGGAFSLATLKEQNLKARPFKKDWSKAQKDSKGKLSDADQAALFEDLKQSFEFGTIEMAGLSAQGTDSKGPQTFSLANFTMRDFAKGKVGGMSLRGVGVEGPGVKVSLGSLEIGPFNLPTPKGAAASQDATSAMLPSAIKVDLSKLDIDVTPKDDSKVTNRVALKVAHASFVSEGEAGDIPKSSKLSIENVTFDVPPGNDKAQPLIDMGYSHLDLSAGMGTTYDTSSQELNLQNLTLKGASMGSIGLGLQLANVTKGIISPNKEIAKASAVAILVKGLSLDLVNDGFVDQVLAWKAKQDGMSVADEKAFVIDLVTNKLPASFNSANVKTIGAAVAKFIDKPKNLHIGILSKSGFGVASMSLLADPALLIDTLEVKATANQ